MKRKNYLISLKPTFERKPFSSGYGDRHTYKKRPVVLSDIENRISELNVLYNFFLHQTYIKRALITIDYKDIVPKSRRITRIFSLEGKDPSLLVSGARYGLLDSEPFHAITYFVPLEYLSHTIYRLRLASVILRDYYNGSFPSDSLERGNSQRETEKLKTAPMSKTEFFDYMVEISNISRFYRYESKEQPIKEMVVTFFSIFEKRDDLRDFLSNIGLGDGVKVIDFATAILKKEDLEILLKRVPFVVSQVSDFSLETMDDSSQFPSEGATIEHPTNEPCIGVFDTMFDERCYFHEWVEFENLLPYVHNSSPMDQKHGTQVDNILVDGPKFNPTLEDGCGHFRVCHFGVGTKGFVDNVVFLDALDTKVNEHPEIKVWNICLGDRHGVNPNSISLFGAKLDEISKKNNVLFVVAGTNLDKEFKEKTIGSPGDSLNSIVVNSVDRSGKPAPYTRTGPVLTLLSKPDVSYYGGTANDPLMAYSPTGDYSAVGTSFAAPWISRKLAYMIGVLNIEPLVAKALLIDSASGWGGKDDEKASLRIGYGIVPRTIREIVEPENDEIRFIISDYCSTYTTSFMRIPFPIDADKRFHYGAKVMLCYFTNGKRSQGVDYSDEEIDVSFGRTKERTRKDGTGAKYIAIDSINKDKQYDKEGRISEEKARLKYQKWNNTKRLFRPVKGSHPLDIEYDRFWGLSFTALHRLSTIDLKEKSRFGMVVTIKRLDGHDSDVDTFIHDCYAQDIKASLIDVDEMITIDEKAGADITFD